MVRKRQGIRRGHTAQRVVLAEGTAARVPGGGRETRQCGGCLERVCSRGAERRASEVVLAKLYSARTALAQISALCKLCFPLQENVQ